jgi:ribosomal protein S18 acetylase RimI-like enzyme
VGNLYEKRLSSSSAHRVVVVVVVVVEKVRRKGSSESCVVCVRVRARVCVLSFGFRLRRACFFSCDKVMTHLVAIAPVPTRPTGARAPRTKRRGSGVTRRATQGASEGRKGVLDGPKPSLIVDLTAGTARIAPPRRVRGAPSPKDEAVKRVTVEMKDAGNVSIGCLEEEDVDDATNLVMDLFFKVRPQDFLAKNRLKFEQAQRVRAGLMEGVKNAEDRILLAAKVGNVLVGISEVSLPNGKRYGAEKLQPRAPKDKAYLSDVAVSPTQRGRGIGKQLVLAAERAMANMGETAIYTHTKVDNEGAQILFERCGYEEPPEVKASLTQAQIAQRSSKNNPFAKLGLVEVGHILLAKNISASDLPP